MINLWEAIQGLLFVATFGLLTRGAVPASQRPRRAPDLGVAARIPSPRDARDACGEEHGSLTLG